MSFDPVKFRERLGLEDEEISNDEVMEAYAFATSPDDDEPEATPVAASAPANTVARSGMVHIDASAYDALNERVRSMEAVEKRRRNEERDQVIAQAVHDGKFFPARADHWKRVWEGDPEGTRQAIAQLAKGLIPITASGYSTENGEWEDDELDREIARLSPPRAASQKGA